MLRMIRLCTSRSQLCGVTHIGVFAIHMLAVCNHPCQFTYVDVGKVGCVGDAFSYAKISLRRHIVVGSWLQGNVEDFDGTTVRSYIIGDSTCFSSGAIAAEMLQRASIPTSNTIQ